MPTFWSPTITDTIDADLISKAGTQLKMIANFGAGVDHIDVDAAVGAGIIVTNTPGVLTEDTADLAMTLILAVSRRIVEGAQVWQEGRFEGWSPTWMTGRKLWGKRLGIVGMGRIGQAWPAAPRRSGCRSITTTAKPVPAMIAEELGATYWDDLDQMLSRMDLISLNTPATKDTHHLLSARRLARLRPEAILINTARGELIDEARFGRGGGAAPHLRASAWTCSSRSRRSIRGWSEITPMSCCCPTSARRRSRRVRIWATGSSPISRPSPTVTARRTA
jgi:glyoxylate reductase